MVTRLARRMILGAAPAILRGRRAAARLRRLPAPIRLCLGSGRAPLQGWTNLDRDPPADVILDLRRGFPLPAGSVARIYSEHLIEHLTLEEGAALLRECRRVLAPEGILRFATPDLADIVRDYSTGWQRHAWVKWPEYSWIDTGTRMVNVAMRAWEHQYLYDEPELTLRLREAGFAAIMRCAIGASDHLDLRGLETREDSGLILEATP